MTATKGRWERGFSPRCSRAWCRGWGPVSPGRRGQRQAFGPKFSGTGRSFRFPYVRHRSRDAGGAASRGYHTGRSHLVRFCGAYHGWWGDVQPGIGNPVPARENLHAQGRFGGLASGLLADAPQHRLRPWFNPIQALHPNDAAPADSSPGGRRPGVPASTGEAYADWLKRLRAVCTERNIVLIFRRGVRRLFRLARGGRAAGIFRCPGRPS